jgi:hypothetical protein
MEPPATPVRFIRHPVPIFGALTLSLDSRSELELKSAAILPSREKRVIAPPFPALSFEFQKAARDADVAFFVGTSLRDPDMRTVFTACSKRVPTAFVSPDTTVGNGIGDRATIIQQTASKFLISTLPGMLRCESPAEVARELSEVEGDSRSILRSTVATWDSAEPPERRCESIENLAAARVSLDATAVRQLLEDDDEQVRIYALGLVQDSMDRDELMRSVEKAAQAAPGSAFAAEAELLKPLV